VLEYIAFGFLGGVIMNIMPCVLPVLALKVFHTVEAFGDEGHDTRAHGIAYAAGTMFAFAVFALLVIALKIYGARLGWGMHFRNPAFVATLTAVIFAFGLNALGVFEIPIMVSSNPKGSFATGILAAIMSTPCTAPFLGSAAGFALSATTPHGVTFAIFVAVGLGLAAPYVLAGFMPRLMARVLPRSIPVLLGDVRQHRRRRTDRPRRRSQQRRLRGQGPRTGVQRIPRPGAARCATRRQTAAVLVRSAPP
jgi:thiol:disulfide interchange protein DsbD